MRIGTTQRLMTAAGTETSGGAAADQTQGDQLGQTPASLTPKEIAEMVNAAIASHLKRDLGKLIADAVSPISAAVKALETKQTEPTKIDDASKPSPEFLALQRQLEELKTANSAAEARAVATERKAREDRAFGELRTQLGKHVKPEHVELLSKALYYGDKRVEFDDEGRVLFRAQVPQYAGGPIQDQLLPLADGVEAFAKSKEAEIYRPAPTPKQPMGSIPRIGAPPTTNLPGANGNGQIPSVQTDPAWSTRLAAELAAAGVPTGSVD